MEPLKSDFQMETIPDIITNLPDTIIEQILSRLPIRDAARTSVLSTKWRYKWAMLPCLVFDVSSFPLHSGGGPVFTTHPISIIDHILMLHIGPIQSFSLNHRGLVADSAIDRWILQLSRVSIKEFSLNVWNIGKYIVPCSLFSCRSLTSLALCSCFVRPPSTFKGFRHLRSLSLSDVEVTQDVLENLISSCPVLERLKLDDLNEMKGYEGCGDIRINARTLLQFDGLTREKVSFVNTPCLAEVIILSSIYGVDAKDGAARKSSNMLTFFHTLPNLKRLVIDSYFITYLSADFEPTILPGPCLDLDYLWMLLLFNNERHSSTAHAILSIAPNIRKLRVEIDHPLIEINVGSAVDFWENCRDCVFEKLQFVEVFNVCGVKPEMDFIKFIISNSPSLEWLIFNIDEDSDQPESVEKEVVNLMRLSDTTKIVCMGIYSYGWEDE